MKAAIKSIFRRFGYDIKRLHRYKGKANPERPWEDEAAFLQIYQQASGRTLLDSTRLYMLFQLARHAAELPGHYAEGGVYRGGSALLLSICKPADKKLFLFDTFEGMPEVDRARDLHHKGDFNETSLSEVESLFADRNNVIFRKGLFPDTVRGLENHAFCLVHIDFDIYRSVRDACEFFYPRLVKGGAMVFDDYGQAFCPGAKEAVREFCSANNAYEVYLPTGQAILFNFNSQIG